MLNSNKNWHRGFSFNILLIIGSLYNSSIAWSYNQLYVFGDSLSDTGNIARYTFDNKKYFIYGEILAKHIGATPTFSNNGGLNYAAGGATASPEINPTNNTANQVTAYLHAVKGKADANGLYIPRLTFQVQLTERGYDTVVAI